MVDRLHRAAREVGAHDMRPSFGFVIRAVAAEEPTVGRLAELLGTTKQAASKLSDDMVDRGYLLRATDRRDRRRIRLRLAAKGRRVHERARAESMAIERELRTELGHAAIDGLRDGLLSFIEREGALAEVEAQRSRLT